MIFYDCSTAPNPRRARMFIAEKSLTIESHDISIAKSEQLGEAFKDVNPQATVPVLITDEGTALTENLGIAAYLEAMHPEPPLMGESAQEKGLVLMWNAIAEQQGGVPIAEALRNSNPFFQGRAIPGPVDYAQVPELTTRGLDRTKRFFELLEHRLQASPYLATNSFTLADISAFVFVEFARVIKMRIPEQNNATLAWHAAIKARPSAQI
ncbi:glutathione S-transferase [Rhodobacterales bacterium 56_14_T64]|nr:glutathione S-transferase [Rhodobacterales bacterium 56_14_T64]